MRKRDRLFRLLKRASSRSSSDRETPTPPPGPQIQPAPEPEPQPAPIAMAEPEVAPERTTEPAKETAPPQTDEAASDSTDGQDGEQDAKIARHFEKTRVAMLNFLVKQGGSSPLKEMHDLSERRYFIAHRRFSDLMESLVDEKLIDFDQQQNEATISALGREYIQA